MTSHIIRKKNYLDIIVMKSHILRKKNYLDINKSKYLDNKTGYFFSKMKTNYSLKIKHFATTSNFQNYFYKMYLYSAPVHQ